MDTRIVTICEYFRPEAERYLREQPMPDDVKITVVPGRCDGFFGCPLAIRGPGGVALDGSAGGTGAAGDRTRQSAPQLRSGGCLSLLAPEWLLENLVREGAYLVSPGWLAHWQEHVRVWGFNSHDVREFARESMRSVCLIDTLVDPQSPALLQELAGALGLPALRIPVGLTYFSAMVEEAVRAAQSAPEPAPVQTQADYAMALDLLSELVRIQTERGVITQIIEVFALLFAPHDVRVVRYADGSPHDLWLADGLAEIDAETLAHCTAINDQTTSVVLGDAVGDGVAVPLDFLERRLAVVFVGEFAMPHRRDEYRNVMESIAPMCSLSLNNARNYEAVLAQEAELKQQHAALTSALSFRDRLLSIIGHDLRGPIGSMHGLLGILVADLSGKIAAEDQHALSELAKTAGSTYDLLIDLLEWANLQRETTMVAVELPVRSLVATVFEITCRQADAKGISQRNEVPETFAWAIDPRILKTILRNLISNAIKFSLPGGRVVVRAIGQTDTKRLEVQDTGVGMDAETIAAVLDVRRRYSTPGTAGEQGTGFGLVFCRELAAKVGVDFKISSEPGVGTTVALVW